MTAMTSRLESAPDDRSWRILHALQENARLSFKQLGRRVGLSAPAVAERVRRLQESGVITGYHVRLNLEKLFPVVAIIRIQAPEAQCVALGGRVRELEEVVESYRVTGDDRLIVKVVATSVPHLDWVMSQLGRFGTPTASIVLKTWVKSVTPCESGLNRAPTLPGRSRRSARTEPR